MGGRGVTSPAEKFGFEETFAKIPALPLGVTEVTMRELTAAYTAFPTLGIRVEPYLVREIRDDHGKSLFTHESGKSRVTDAGAAYVMHSLLRGVVPRRTASLLNRSALAHVSRTPPTTNNYPPPWLS